MDINKIYLGDCLDVMKDIPDNSIDLTVTSPPYNIGKKYNSHFDNMKYYLDWLIVRLSEIVRVSNSLWINLGYRKLDIGNVPICFQIYDKIDMFLMQHIVWEYGAGMTYKKRFNHRKEDWLWFVKDKTNYVFNPDDVRDLSLTKYKQDKRNNPNGKLPSDVWYFPHVAGNFGERKNHPAQYPITMIERIIKACSNPNDIVFDPFVGSGSTLYAAKKLNRKFIGIEKDEKYFNIANERIKSIC